MATVWRAHHLMLAQEVAIKLVKPELRLGELTQRLILEAQVEAQLVASERRARLRLRRRPRTAALHGDGAARGPSLPTRSRARRDCRRASVRLLLPVIDALAARARARHRAPRPQAREHLPRRTATTTRLRPKILDFGIAKLAARRLRLAASRSAGIAARHARRTWRPSRRAAKTDVDYRSRPLVDRGRPLRDGDRPARCSRGRTSGRCCTRSSTRRSEPWPVTSDAMISLWPILESALRKSRERARPQRARARAAPRPLAARARDHDRYLRQFDRSDGAPCAPGDGGDPRRRPIDLRATDAGRAAPRGARSRRDAGGTVGRAAPRVRLARALRGGRCRGRARPSR